MEALKYTYLIHEDVVDDQRYDVLRNSPERFFVRTYSDKTSVRELQKGTENGAVRIGKRHEKFTNNGFQWRRILCTAKVECTTTALYAHKEKKNERRCSPCLVETRDMDSFVDMKGLPVSEKALHSGRQVFDKATVIVPKDILESIRAYQAKAVCIPHGPAREQFVTAFKEEMKAKMGDTYFEVSHREVFPEYKVVTNFVTAETYIVRCDDRTMIAQNHRREKRQFINYKKNKSVTKAHMINAIFNGFIAPGKKTHTAHLIANKKESIFVLDLAYMSGTQNRAEAHREPKRKKATIRNNIEANPDEDVLVRLGNRPAVMARVQKECSESDKQLLEELSGLDVCNRGYVIKADGWKHEGRKLNRGLYIRMTSRKEVPVHKLVGMAFLLDKIEALERETGETFKLLDSCKVIVYHKDKNRMNNHVDNLEIVSKGEATKRGRKRPRK